MLFTVIAVFIAASQTHIYNFNFNLNTEFTIDRRKYK